MCPVCFATRTSCQRRPQEIMKIQRTSPKTRRKAIVIVLYHYYKCVCHLFVPVLIQSDSPAKQKMATVAQPTSKAFPVLSNGIDDSRIKNSTLIENGTKVSVSKMKTHPPSYVSNPVSKQNGNYSSSSSDGESSPLVNGTASPKPHKTSQVILH